MKKAMFKLFAAKETMKERLRSNKGEAYVDMLIKILIAVVVGALILGLLVMLVNTLWPELSAQIMDMFNAGGGGAGDAGAGGGAGG